VQWIYLDNNATTRPADEVVQSLQSALTDLWANPSSVHRFGQMVRQQVELARASVAKLLGVRPRTIIFTSGGTESNNLALRGTRPNILITTKIEHAAIREPAESLSKDNIDVRYLPLGVAGLVNPQALDGMLSELHKHDGLILISVQWANNETGVLQPIEEFARVVQQHRSERDLQALLHVDATQAVGKIPVDAAKVGVDMLTLSAHKFHGPKGVGTLYVRRGVKLQAQQLGGPQETEKRGGTENTACIIAMGIAAQLAQSFVEDESRRETIRELRDGFEQAVQAAIPDAVINGVDAPRLWNTTNIGFPRLEAEAILLGLSEKGVCASAGAACSSGSLEPSPVLLAMGTPEPVAHGSVRFSLSRETTKEEVTQAAQIVADVVQRLSRTLPL